MITVTGRNLEIPEDEKFIGIEGDNLVEQRVFEISNTSLFDFNFKLDLHNSIGGSGIVEPIKTIEGDKAYLTWNIEAKDITAKGLLKAQLRAFVTVDDTIPVWHSEITHDSYFMVGAGINATESFPPVLPSEFTTMEANVTSMKNEAVAAAGLAAETVEAGIIATFEIDKTAFLEEKSVEITQAKTDMLAEVDEEFQVKYDGLEAEYAILLSGKAEKTALDAVASGSPKPYSTLAAINAAFPTGDSYSKLNAEDDYWYYWNGSVWAQGALYLPKPEDVFTLTNLHPNGSVESGTTGFSPITTSRVTVTSDSTEAKIGTKSLKVVAIATGGVSWLYNFNAVEGNVYYISFWTKNGTNDNRQIDIYCGTKYYFASPVNNETITDTGWVFRSYYFKAIVSGTTYIKEAFKTYDIGMSRFYDGLTILDLSASFGLGLEPSTGALDKYIYANIWIDGTVEIGLSELYTKNSVLKNKKIVCFGDSIVALGLYPQYVGLFTDSTVYNCGFGGCRMSAHPTANYDAFSMSNLATAIASGDWSVQDTAALSLADANITEKLTTLKAIDFNAIDSITIGYGTNDLGGAVTLGTNADTTDATFKGAINFVISTILTAYPNLQIYFITPIFRADTSVSGNSDTFVDSKGNTLKDFCNAIIDLANIYHLPSLNLYDSSGINSLAYHYWLSYDFVHPSAKGYDLMGQKVAKFLISE